MNKTCLKLLILVLLLSSCLRTRAELGEVDQSNTYSQKNAANQMEAQQEKAEIDQSNSTGAISNNEKDELIRNLNGRVEVLENQLVTLQKEREEENKQNEQKLVLLQEAITKLSKGEVIDGNITENKETSKAPDENMLSSDQIAEKKSGKKESETDKAEKVSKKLNAYEAAEEYFEKKEWKKAILSFHKYTDESPKGKLVPDAKYKIGICFQELGMKDEAMAYFEEVVANYNSTDAGKKSKSRLNKLKK